MPPRFKRAIILVADGVGCGGAPDAAAYGDAGADTLGNLARAVGGLALPNLQALGLGNLTAIAGVRAAAAPRAAWGVMREASAGKDTITGHWEMAGLVTDAGDGDVSRTASRARSPRRCRRAAGRGLLGNKTASGTAIIDELGAAARRHRRSRSSTRRPTRSCRSPRTRRSCRSTSCTGSARRRARSPTATTSAASSRGRSSARRARSSAPTTGATSRWCRRRRRCSTTSADAGQSVVGVGKISDIFAGRGLGYSIHSEGNADGMHLTLEALATLDRGLLFVNLVDFDMLYGHRNDVAGFARALVELDRWLPRAGGRAAPRRRRVHHRRSRQRSDRRPAPTTRASRCRCWRSAPRVRPARLGTRASFCDLGQTIADGLGVAPLARGESFLAALRGPA